MPIKGISCFSSGGHFVPQNKTILKILVEGHSRNISVKLFLKWAIGLQEMSFKGFLFFSSGCHFVDFSNFGKGSPKEHFCETIVKSTHWPRRGCRLKFFYC